MAKKSFWQGLKDFFKDDGPHLITDEEWEAMQAEEAARAAAEEAAQAAQEGAQAALEAAQLSEEGPQAAALEAAQLSEEGPQAAALEAAQAAREGAQAAALEAAQAARESAQAAPDDDGPLRPAPPWRCPECHAVNPGALLFCARCGYRSAPFQEILPRMTEEQIELVLHGSCRYPAQELRLLEQELARRRSPAAAPPPAEEGPVDEAELARLTLQYQDSPAAALYEVLADEDYTPAARRAARAELARRGLPQGPDAAQPGQEAAPAGWKCTRCGRQNPEESYFCTACGEYRY